MKRIFKYQILPDRTIVDLPKGSKIISVANQRETLCFWALVDTNETEIEKVIFEVKMTGEIIDNFKNLLHLGTVLMQNGDLVVHVFIRSKEGE